MSNKSILYFDKVLSDFNEILQENKPKEFTLWLWHELTDSQKADTLAKADYLMVATEKLTADMISQAVNARLIQKTGIGVDNIDLEAAATHQIPVANTPGANAIAVAELTILLILALYRKILIANEATKSGRWLMWELRSTSFEMSGKTHGFIGFGNIGRETAKRSAAFGTNIVYYDKFRLSEELEKELHATYLPLDDVLKSSDILSLHIPLLPETINLIGTRELGLMKRSAIIVNVSRGGIVNEAALYQALEDGMLTGAALDVWEKEPVPADNPLLSLDNVIATPHVGAGTQDTLHRVLRTAFTNIKHVEDGRNPDFILNGITTARNV